MGKFDALVDESAASVGGGGSSGKACSACGGTKAQDAFSNKQWSGKAHSRKCIECATAGSKGEREPLSWTKSAENSTALTSPPPWYDEDLGPEYVGEDNTSMVVQEEYLPMLLKIEKGEMGADDDLVKPEFRHLVNTGMTGLQSGAGMADVPFMKAVLRRGARIDRFSLVEV